MKYASRVGALLLLFAFGVRAGDSPSPTPAATAASAPSDTLPASDSVKLDSSATSAAATSAASSNTPAPQIGVINVEPSFSFQAYGGYTFVRVYAFPSREVNRNGVDVSLSYFFRKGLIGLEGAVTGAFGSIGSEHSDFAFYGGGPRVRLAGPAGIELWAHGLAGEAHFGPQVPVYGQDGVAYEVGGGVDIKAHWRRFAYRVEGDMIGSRLYNTSQYSPKFSVGIVYKF
jgi:hypothetical protein